MRAPNGKTVSDMFPALFDDDDDDGDDSPITQEEITEMQDLISTLNQKE